FLVPPVGLPDFPPDGIGGFGVGGWVAVHEHLLGGGVDDQFHEGATRQFRECLQLAGGVGGQIGELGSSLQVEADGVGAFAFSVADFVELSGFFGGLGWVAHRCPPTPLLILWLYRRTVDNALWAIIPDRGCHRRNG